MEHKTVFRKEAIDLLKVKKGGIYIDVTLGGGGHSLKIIESAEDITLICFDLDKANIEAFHSKLNESGISNKVVDSNFQNEDGSVKVFLINDNFSKVKEYLDILEINKVDGIIADLGWSSDQLQNIPGLSFQNLFEELDMRLSSEFGVKAKDLLNGLGRKELIRMFEEYGDIKGSQNQKLVNSILKFRSAKLFESVGDLIEAIEKSFGNNKYGFNNSKVTEYPRIFQSLRIAVNNEINNLKELLKAGWEIINTNGVFVIITFHSGEERIIKNFFNNLIQNKDAVFTSTQYGENYTRPTVEELTENLRSRSAKLWTVEKHN